MNQVIIHQTVIGLEAQAQLAKAGESGADFIFGCAGGVLTWAAWLLPLSVRTCAKVRMRG